MAHSLPLFAPLIQNGNKKEVLMKKLVALSFLFPCLVMAAGQASETTTEDNSGFFDGSTVKAKITNEYFGLISDEYQAYTGQEQSKSDLTNWVNAIKVDFESGYLSDVFGANVSAYGVQALDAGDTYYGKKYLKGGYGQEAEGFLTLKEYHLKQKFNVNDTQVYLTQGVTILRDFGVLDREQTVVESSYRGLAGEVNSGGWNYKLAVVDGLHNSNSPKVEDFIGNDEVTEIDYIVSGDISYKFGPNKLRYKAGYSDDYMTKQGVTYDRFFDGGNLQVYGLVNTALDGYQNQDAEKQLFDHNAYHFGTELNLFLPKSFVKFAYTYTDAKRNAENGIGKFELAMSKNTVTNPGFAKGDSRHYSYDGQHMFGLLGIHEINDQFKAGISARYAMGAEYQGADLVSGEWVFIGIFEPSQNMNIEVVAGKDFGFYQSFDGKPVLDSKGEAQKANGDVFVTRVSYTF